MIRTYLIFTLLLINQLTAVEYSRVVSPGNTVNVNDTIWVMVEIRNEHPDTLKGLVYSEQIPFNVLIIQKDVTLNDNNFNDFVFEVGELSEVANNHIPYRWVFQEPGNFSSPGYLLTNDVVTFTFGITIDVDTSFSLNHDAWYGGLYYNTSYTSVFGYDSINIVTLNFEKPINAIPSAVDDEATTDEDSSVVIDLLFNDSDEDGSLDPSAVNVVRNPTRGSISDPSSVDGSIRYTPFPDYYGVDSLSYTVNDDLGATSNEAEVHITINSVNDPPVARNDSQGLREDEEVVIDILANDSDIDGSIEPSSVNLLVNPQHGNITYINTMNGNVTYLPTPGYTGDDYFIYSVADNNDARSDSAIVDLTITEQENTNPFAPEGLKILK